MDWWKRQKNGVVDTILTNYCAKNVNAVECKCINVSLLTKDSEIFKEMAAANAPVTCWWLPCQSQLANPNSIYLSTLQMIQNTTGKCPNVCISTVDISADIVKNVKISQDPSCIVNKKNDITTPSENPSSPQIDDTDTSVNKNFVIFFKRV